MVDENAPIGPQGMEVVLGTGFVWPATGTITVLPNNVTVATVEPSAIPQEAGLVTLIIQGEGFIDGEISSFEFPPASNIGIIGTPTIISDTDASIDINVPTNAIIGVHDLAAYFGIYEVATGTGLLEIIPHVAVTSVAPNNLMQGQQSQTLVIHGEGFIDNSTVAFASGGIEITNLSFASSTELQVQVDVDQDAATGLQDVEGCGGCVGGTDIHRAPIRRDREGQDRLCVGHPPSRGLLRRQVVGVEGLNREAFARRFGLRQLQDGGLDRRGRPDQDGGPDADGRGRRRGRPRVLQPWVGLRRTGRRYGAGGQDAQGGL